MPAEEKATKAAASDPLGFAPAPGTPYSLERSKPGMRFDRNLTVDPGFGSGKRN